MPVELSMIQKICRHIQSDVAMAYPGLTLHFVFHRTGKLRESLALAEHEIVEHPAGKAAMAVVRKHTKTENSAFIGLAIANEKRMMGFKRIDHLIGLFNINSDEFDTEQEARAQIYHMVWHAIDLYEIRLQPSYADKFKSGPMVPKRSALNISKAHLQADAFAAILSSLEGHEDDSSDEGTGDSGMMEMIANKRGIQSLSPIQNYKAEDFPSVIALDACRFAIKELEVMKPHDEDHIETARRVSLEVGHTFDSANMQQWWDFSIPAQDMAWRGFEQEEILGAAVNVCEDPFVRSIGYLIQEVSGIEPVAADSLEHSYNAFMDPEVNMKLHREMVDTIFEEAISLSLSESSSRAFLNMANEQNEKLTEGRFLGWCAAALQGAAKAFERALINGTAPDQAARMHFSGSRGDDETEWESLIDLSNQIVDQKRQGYAVTMGHIAEICHSNPAFAPVLDSLKITMNDPAYIQKLEASNDLAMVPSGPSGPSLSGPEISGPEVKGPELGPKAPTPNVPSMPSPGPSMPGLGGGGNRAAQIMRQRQMLEAQKRKEQEGAGDHTE